MSLNIKTSQGLKRINTVHITKPQIETKDVNFYDYDGTLIKSYSKNDFLKLNSLPANPTREGLTAQGWNWSLSDAKTYVTTNGKLDIGQMYITSDGKTRLYVHMEEGRLNPELDLTFAETGSFTVDWGDNTTPNTVSGEANTRGSIAHTYSTAGDYVITVTVVSGKVSIVGKVDYARILKKLNTYDSANSVYNNCIRAVRLGSGVASIGTNAFSYCHSLTSVTIPSGITSIGDDGFTDCSSLTSITIPNNVTSISGGAFRDCCCLTSVSIPNSVISIGRLAFYQCPLTSITIPNSVTSIEADTFSNCNTLTSITIPSDVTSIEAYTFNWCSLTSITIPSSITSIKAYAFNYCQGLGFIKFKGATPPTVTNSNAFWKLPTDCIIYVPEGTLSAYTTATNYPSSATYNYVEY